MDEILTKWEKKLKKAVSIQKLFLKMEYVGNEY
jgi:hypothetical protein